MFQWTGLCVTRRWPLSEFTRHFSACGSYDAASNVGVAVSGVAASLVLLMLLLMLVSCSGEANDAEAAVLHSYC